MNESEELQESAMSTQSDLQEYVARLLERPERGHVIAIRFTNKRTVSLGFQIEPTGDIAPPLEPQHVYQVVVQDHFHEYGSLDVHIEDDGVRVWVEGADGQVFSEGVSVAY